LRRASHEPSKAKEFITLKPGKVIDVEIEAKLKKDKQKLFAELCRRQLEAEKKDTPRLKIYSRRLNR